MGLKYGAPQASLTAPNHNHFAPISLTLIYYCHCAWFYKRGKRGSYLVLAIAPFWLQIELGPKIAIWRSQ